MTDAELEKAFWELMASDPNFQSESVGTQSWCLRAFILGYNKRKKEVPRYRQAAHRLFPEAPPNHHEDGTPVADGNTSAPG